MKSILFQATPFDKKLVTLALESGVDAIVAEAADHERIAALGRVALIAPEDFTRIELASKDDEERAVAAGRAGERVLLAKGYEIIPVENILAQLDELALEVDSLDSAKVAAGVLERGASHLVVLPEAAADLKAIVAELKLSQGTMPLSKAVVTKVESAGLGHRVCVDTTSVLKRGQGMLVGNSSAFTFLVHAETESNPYVAARPFRINAGAVHAYAAMPQDKTAYLEELSSGREVLIVNHDGASSLATVGRSKVEVRPMLLIEAEADGAKGAVFLQNAETIRLVRPGGDPVSVVSLKPGDEILCRLDSAGRHFGMKIKEDITEG
ncbi:MAG: 3-dehydroquinate synthase [Desulfovibrionales bacterium]|jgi:3-dehydroquinate synthase II|nr:3-dehydroquinate synthase [Desulfovibrionales bacterium]